MIQIFITGGTFDKEYNYITGELTFYKTHVDEMLKRGRCGVDVAIETIMMVDSLDIADDDRTKILDRCQTIIHRHIVITHGTDTMVETAQFLARSNLGQSKTVVLMGAMIPYTFGTSSDGFFNIGAAMAFVQCKEPGIYVAMNGRCFDWNNVKKNYNTGFFEAVTS
ncbi:MAG: asparaginase [Saprospiraceae bacterium]|nr:asparaginase [Saprospiraceae bacterium]